MQSTTPYPTENFTEHPTLPVDIFLAQALWQITGCILQLWVAVAIATQWHLHGYSTDRLLIEI